MRWIRRAQFRLRTLVGRAALEQQLDEELQFHLEMQTLANVRLGMPQTAAQTLARAQFGSVSQHKDDYRDRWGARHVEAIAEDLRSGIRQVWSQRTISLAIVLLLSVGIGVSTAVFSVFHAVFVRPLPYADPDRLVRLHVTTGTEAGERLFSAAEIRDLRAEARTLDGVAEFHHMYFILLDDVRPRRVSAGVVSANFFTVAGVSPLVGRVFLSGEDRPGAPGVIVLSHAYWMRGFGGDPQVVGRTVRLNDQVHTIVGVLPQLPEFPEAADVYLPTSACPLRIGPEGDQDRGMHLVSALARLTSSPSSDPAPIKVDLHRAATVMSAHYTSDDTAVTGLHIGAVSATDALTQRFRPTLLALMASTGFLFLSVCASAGALIIANALKRRPRVALLTALGAWRGRLLRQFMVEAFVIAAMGGLAAVFVARLSLPPLIALASRYTARAGEIHLVPAAIGFVAALTLAITSVLALITMVTSESRSLGERSAPPIPATHPLFRSLIVLQIAVAFALLIGAGLTIRSVRNLARIETGFQTTDVLTFRVSADFIKYQSFAERASLFERLVERVRSLPGIDAASLSGALPLIDAGHVGEEIVSIPDSHQGLDTTQRTALQTVSVGYFDTVGQRVVDGRDFSVSDEVDAPKVAIVNQSMAKRHWGDRSPIGRHISVAGGDLLTVIGVVSDARQRLNAPPMEEVFRPLRQLPLVDRLPLAQARLFVRSRLPQSDLETRIRDAVWSVDPQQPIDSVLTLANAREESVAPSRLTASLITALAVLALAISTVGLVGVVGSSVQGRSQEIGLRLALGATKRRVIAHVLREAVLLAGWGLALGFGLAYSLSRVLDTLLFEVPAFDVPTIIVVVLLLIVVTLTACIAPARRAASIDPNVTLRV